MSFRIPQFNPTPIKNCFANVGVDTFTIMFALIRKVCGYLNNNNSTNNFFKVQGEQSERVLAVILSVVSVRCMYVL